MKTVQKILTGMSIMIGGMIYILFRSHSLIMFDWFKKLLFVDIINKMRITSMKFSKSLPEWFVFSLPDGLWLFSYISVVLLVWKNQITKHSIAWILIIPLYAIVLELGQLFKFKEGTFDINDLLFYSIAIISPFILYKNLLTIKF